MGVNKSNVRYVLHVEVPTSMLRYAQEVGRGGRDGQSCRCVILWRDVDGQKVKLRPGSEEALREARTMIDFCEQQEQCRKVFLKAYFHEVVTSRSCTSCDVCNLPVPLQERRDCRSEALQILQVARDARRPGVSFTKLCTALGASGVRGEGMLRKVIQVMVREGILVELVATLRSFRTLVLAPCPRSLLFSSASAPLQVCFSEAIGPAAQAGQPCWASASSTRGSSGKRAKRGPGKSQHPCPHCQYSTELRPGRYGWYRACTQLECGWKRNATGVEAVVGKHGAKSIASRLGASYPLRHGGHRLWAGSPRKRPSAGSAATGAQGVREVKPRRV